MHQFFVKSPSIRQIRQHNQQKQKNKTKNSTSITNRQRNKPAGKTLRTFEISRFFPILNKPSPLYVEKKNDLLPP
jgi:hypothetical protein